MPTRGLLGKKYFKKAIIITITMMMAFFCFLFGVHEVLAQGAAPSLDTGIDRFGNEISLAKTDIRLIVAQIIRAALGFLGIISVVLMMYSGFVWMTAGGNEEQVGRAKKILINATIGLVIILSAYGIVLFVMRMLGIGAAGLGGPTYKAPGSSHFQGSGALGGIIKDHYPDRDQKGVARNTKIVITFRKPILASSAIADTNKNGIFGDCIQGTTFSWKDPKICDRLLTSDGKIAVSGSDVGKLDDKYINIVNLKTGQPIKAAAVLAATSTVNNITGVYTIVIKPLTDLSQSSGGYLGGATENIGYKVRLGQEMRLEDAANNNPKVFSNAVGGNNYYEWRFTCGTALDVVPPKVVSVYPRSGMIAPKNSVIQINFSEAMDPTGIQGSFASGTTHYEISNGHVFLKADNTTKPLGNFILTNGYRTLEFTSTKPCEKKNACGKTMYCLTVCDKPGVACGKKNILKAGKIESIEVDNFSMILRSAVTLGKNSFEAKPFSGVMDLASNALDGDKDGKVDTAPTTTPVFPNQKKPDNYYWDFAVKNQIDLDSAYLTKVTPGPVSYTH